MDEDNPTLGLVHQLRALTVELDLAAGAFAAGQGLHGTDLRALIALLDAERAGTTALVDRLAARTLVSRGADPADRRRVVLTVTEEARAMGWQFFGPLIGGIVDALDADFDAAEREVLGRVLTRLVEVAGAQSR